MKMSRIVWLFVVALLVFGFACQNSESPTAPTPPSPSPVANFRVVADGLTVTFVNGSQNATRYRWSFGDGLSSGVTSPTHTYPRAGRYVVTLEAFNAAQEVDSAQVPINVTDF